MTATLVYARNGLVASSLWYLLRLSRIFGLCNKSKLSGAETDKLLMQVLLDSSRYRVRNMPLLMQHDIHLSEEQCHVAIKPFPVSNTSFSFQTDLHAREGSQPTCSRAGHKQVSSPSCLSQNRPGFSYPHHCLRLNILDFCSSACFCSLIQRLQIPKSSPGALLQHTNKQVVSCPA